MGEKKRQHYVPQFYLKNFVRENNKFTVLNIRNGKIIEEVPYKKQCYENYYYGNDGMWEEKLGEIERKTSLIINKILNQSTYYPNLKEISTMKEFVLYQRYRTTRNTENLLDMEWSSAKTCIEMEFDNKRKKLPESILNQIQNQFEQRYRTMIPQQALDVTSHLLNKIDDLELIIIQYNNEKQKLISSDNPVIFYNPFNKRALGLVNAGLIIIFPISPKKLIVIFDSKMYSKYKGKKIVNLNNENEVKKLNTLQLIVAKDIVYFQDKNQSEIIKKQYKENKKVRIEFTENGQAKALGTSTNKMIAFPQSYIPINYEFTFGKLPYKATGFGENEIDWFPRNIDQEYEKRMQFRPILFKTLPGIMNKKYTKPNIKNIERFNKLVYEYWNNKL